MKVETRTIVVGRIVVDSFEEVGAARVHVKTLGEHVSVDVVVSMLGSVVRNKALDADRLVAKGCLFINCNFEDVCLDQCELRDCMFVNCNISNASWGDDPKCVIQGCFFDKDCKLGWETLGVLRWNPTANTFVDDWPSWKA